MKAVVCKEFGLPEKLVYGDHPDPEPGPNDVRIAVEAAGVNFPDVLIIQNKYQFKGTPPFVPGGEVTGRIVEVGSALKDWKVGDRVAALCMQGGFAEQTVAPASACIPVPDGMPAAEAAGFPLVYGPDVLIIQNKYQFKGTPPFVPGGEVTGRIVEVGSALKDWKVGDRVAALCMQGGFAEQTVAPASACIPVPDGMPAAEAAGFPLVYGTDIHALVQRGQLKAGETLLVLGAAGGVGLAAVQLGKILGARVIAAASSPEKLAVAKSQGADDLVDYSKESLKDAVKKLTGGHGADVIFDPVGGDLAQECFSCINWNGRYLVIGFADGKIPEVALNRLLLKGASAVGVFWGAFTVREPAAQAANVEQLFAWYREGRFKPIVSKEYPLAQGAQALRDMMERKVTGKVVLVV